MTRTRVLVVDDSLTVRRYIVDVLRADPELEIVGEASDGRQAIELCLALRPDVITLDMMMPVMTGAAVTEYIMAHCPTPILVVSASTNRGEVHRTYDALAAGAVDVLEKPLGDDPRGGDAWERDLVEAVKLVARIKVITHLRGKLGLPPAGTPAAPPLFVGVRAPLRVIAIGASTGGPGAILQILRALPASFPIPILLVLHISKPFGAAFADWLDGQTSLRVRYARSSEPLPPVGKGEVIMAPPDSHLVVERERLRLTDDAPRHSCRPSIDSLFDSLARDLGPQTAACLLTGMGRDGADGLLALRHAGARTVAQDEASCVIFGMPREAIALGAAELVLPIDRIANRLLALVGREDRGEP